MNNNFDEQQFWWKLKSLFSRIFGFRIFEIFKFLSEIEKRFFYVVAPRCAPICNIVYSRMINIFLCANYLSSPGPCTCCIVYLYRYFRITFHIFSCWGIATRGIVFIYRGGTRNPDWLSHLVYYMTQCRKCLALSGQTKIRVLCMSDFLQSRTKCINSWLKMSQNGPKL